MTVLVTGAAGFLGYHVARALLARGETVAALDSLNDYYDVALKQARLERLRGTPGFSFHRVDLARRDTTTVLAERIPGLEAIVHLAAQPGVGYSLVNPHAYTASNVEGQLNVLELARQTASLKHLVYASSSSVYGANETVPFSIEHRVDSPVSFYAATKRAGELMSQCYSHLHGIPATGLRFFTVYGPWGRPDMAPYIFTRALFEGSPIRLFNNGRMRRDFTFVDDCVAGILAALDRPPQGTPPHRVYNLGNGRGEPLGRFVKILEKATGRKAVLETGPMQPGDVKETHADIEASRRDLGFAPATGIDEGLPRFVAWYRDYHGVT